MNVGELIAYIKVDDSQFNAGLSRSRSAMQGFGQLAKAAGQVVATTLTAGTAAAGGLATSLIKTGAAYNALQQNSRAALSVMLGSAEKANAQMDKLDAFARNSPFAKQVFIQAQQQLLGFGVQAEKVIPTLDAVQNAVASMGGGSVEIERATYALAQLQSTGKFSGETLRDLGVMGIDAATIVGDKMGKTGAEIRAMASKPGGIPADQVWDPLITGLTEKFGGATDLVKQQWTGAVDRIKGAWRDIGASLAEPFIDPNGGGKAVEWANLVADGLRGIERHVKNAMPIIESAMGSTFGRVEDTLRKANAAVAGFNLDGAVRQIQNLTKYEPLVASTGTALLMLGLKPVPVIGGLASGMMPLLGAIAALVATDPQLRGLGDAFATGLGDAGSSVDDLIVSTADLAMELLGELAPGLLAGAEGAGKLAGLGLDVASVLIDVLGAATPLVGVVSDLVGVVADLPAPVLAGVAAFIALRGLEIPNIFGRISTAAKGFSDQMRLQQALAKMNGTEIGTMGAAAATAGARISGAVVSVRAFGSALKAAFVANAPLLAITALVAAIGFFAQKAQEAQARADAYAQALDGVTKAADRTAAAAEVATNALVTGDNADWGWWQKMQTGFKSAADALEHFGFTAEGAGEAVAGTQAEFDAYIGSLERAGTENGYVNGAVGELVIKLHQQRNAMSEAERQAIQKAQADADAADAAEQHSAALKAQAEALDRVTSAERGLAAAKGDLVSAQYATKDAATAATEALSESGRVSRDASGAVDTTTASYRALDEASLDLQRAMSTELDAMVKAGASQDDLNAKRDEFLGKQRANAEAWGLEGEEVDAYIDRIGGVPEVVSTQVEANTVGAIEDLELLVAQIADTHGTMIIDARNDLAQQRLLESLGLVNDGTGIFSIDADNNPAMTTLLASLGLVDTSTGTLTIDGQDEEAMARLAEAVQIINGSSGTLSILGKDLTGSTRQEAIKLINSSTGTIKIYGTDYATGVADDIIRRINGKTAYIRINGTQVAQGQGGSGGITQADGGLVQTFSNGGRYGAPEQHIAQYVPAGTWRVFGEDETGGEWYIPRAQSKRARSLQIAQSMARDFGFQMVPLSAKTVADGSPPSSSVSTREVREHLTAFLTDEQVERLAIAFEKGSKRVAVRAAKTAIGG